MQALLWQHENVTCLIETHTQTAPSVSWQRRVCRVYLSFEADPFHRKERRQTFNTTQPMLRLCFMLVIVIVGVASNRVRTLPKGS